MALKRVPAKACTAATHPDPTTSEASRTACRPATKRTVESPTMEWQVAACRQEVRFILLLISQKTNLFLVRCITMSLR